MVSKLSYFNTSTALAEAAAFADQFCGPTHSTPTIRHNHDHYHWGPSFGWGSPFPYAGSSGGNSKPKGKNFSWLAIPATLVAFGTLYFIGQNHAEWIQSKESMVQLRQKTLIVQTELAKAHAHPTLKTVVQTVFNTQMDLLEQIRSNAVKGLFLKAVLLTSMLVIGAGALASSGILLSASLTTPLLAYGGGSAFLTASAMFYRTGFSSGDKSLNEGARRLRISAHQASDVLNEIIHSKRTEVFRDRPEITHTLLEGKFHSSIEDFPLQKEREHVQ